MRSRGALIGLALLLIVMAVVLYLSAENWKAVAPKVPELVSEEGATQAAEETLGEEAGDLPGLGEMKAETDDHAKELEEALAATE